MAVLSRPATTQRRYLSPIGYWRRRMWRETARRVVGVIAGAGMGGGNGARWVAGWRPSAERLGRWDLGGREPVEMVRVSLARVRDNLARLDRSRDKLTSNTNTAVDKKFEVIRLNYDLGSKVFTLLIKTAKKKLSRWGKLVA
jgi:hypothetical protein